MFLFNIIGPGDAQRTLANRILDRNQDDQFAAQLAAAATAAATSSRPPAPARSLLTQLLNYVQGLSPGISQAGRSLVQTLLNLQVEGNINLTPSQIQTAQTAITRLATPQLANLAGVLSIFIRENPGFVNNLNRRLSRFLNQMNDNNPDTSNISRTT